jgi:ABC-type sugar transport system ATPase subunit
VSEGLTGDGDAPIVVASGIQKRFGPAVVLDDVSISFRAGVAHALVGQNGAGKSTLLSVIAGKLTPDRGELRIGGTRVRQFRPRSAQALGVAAVYQELGTVNGLTAAQNVFLGRERAEGSRSAGSSAKLAGRYRELCADLGIDIPPDAKATRLSVADRQSLEILRGVAAGARVLLLDEPTATLGPAQRTRLFATLRRLREEGMAVVFVSHYLDEVLDFCDQVTVLRDGRLIDTRAAAEWTKHDLIEAMVPARAAVVAPGPDPAPRPAAALTDAPPVLEVRDLSTRRGTVSGAGFTLRQGEVLGLAGLVGSGRSSLLQSLFGVFTPRAGILLIDGKPIRWPRTPRAAMAAGLGYVPEDRKGAGLDLGGSVAENLLLGNLGAVTIAGVVRPRQAQRRVTELLDRFGVRGGGGPRTAIGALSGGNQQKVLLARWLQRGPRVLLADEPTRGVDVGARADIWVQLRHYADQGGAIVVVSSDFTELFDNCDRVIVMANGRTTRELSPDEYTMESTLQEAFSG